MATTDRTVMETTALRQRYQRDGFVIHPQPVLPADLLARAVEGLDQVRAGKYDTGEEPAGRTWNPGDDPLQLCKIEQPQLASQALREVLRAPRLAELVYAVSGATSVQVWWVQGLIKPGAPGITPAGNVGWHQDLGYWQDWEAGSELFTAWLALSDVTLEAGPMVFVRGSHRWGLIPGGNFFSQDQEAIRAAIRVPAGEEWREVPDLLPPGGVSLHHRLLFHGSHQNTSPRPRRSLAIHLRTENSRVAPERWVARYLDRPEICPELEHH